VPSDQPGRFCRSCLAGRPPAARHDGGESGPAPDQRPDPGPVAALDDAELPTLAFRPAPPAPVLAPSAPVPAAREPGLKAPDPGLNLGGASVRPLQILQWPISALLLGATAVAGMVSATLGLHLSAELDRHPAQLPQLRGIEHHLAAISAELLVAVGVLWLIWWAVAYANLVPLGVRPRHDPAWAVASWFVPFVDLLLPQRVANELWRGSDPWAPLGWRAPRHARIAPLVRWWWQSWCTSFLLVVASEVALRRVTPTTTALAGIDTALILAALLAAVSGITAIRLVTGVTARQRRRADLLVEAGLVPGM
jgi:hypothetical protein